MRFGSDTPTASCRSPRTSPCPYASLRSCCLSCSMRRWSRVRQRSRSVFQRCFRGSAAACAKVGYSEPCLLLASSADRTFLRPGRLLAVVCYGRGRETLSRVHAACRSRTHPSSCPAPHPACPAAAAATGGPSWLQWAFGCVRSRAFKLRDECFACVPYLDVANHHHDPSCDFRFFFFFFCCFMLCGGGGSLLP